MLSVADFCHNDENSKNGKNSFVENARPLGTTSINKSPPRPLAKDMMQKRPSGGKFFMQIPGDARGEGVVMEKIDICMIKVIA